MEPEKDLKALVEGELDLLGYELVKMEAFFSGRRKALRIFIDRPESTVTIDDCVRVTKALGLVLDAAETIPGPFNLEISSPGFARPLTKPAHFARFRGERARVEHLDDAGKKTTAVGTIEDSSETEVTLMVDGAVRVVPYERIARANLDPVGGGREEPEIRRRPRRAKRAGKRF
jgi:ribosome maturation factor RimP